MRPNRLFILAAALMLVACQSISDRGTIARLRRVQIEIEEEKIEGGLDKAMSSYRRFLEETPDSPLAPEAIRRLADLKIEKEYGTLTEPADQAPAAEMTAPQEAPRVEDPLIAEADGRSNPGHAHAADPDASMAELEKRVAQIQPLPPAGPGWDAPPIEGMDDLEREGALEAIALYTKLLDKYPLYKRNDQVLYQMSRAYEELGRIPEAMQVMDRLVSEFPGSRYIDEVQFRRAEFFFAHRRYLDAEEAYTTIVNIGVGSSYYELALYKLGWTFYKQELYEEALHRFIALLDYKVSVGYDFAQIADETERKRTEDTFRVISLSFSNLGGADSVVEYFSHLGKRTYEDLVYSNLAEFYFGKRRYADASATYSAFVSRNPFHEVAPNFHMRIIDIHAAGGFPSLVLDAKKAFATTYGLKAAYWNYFEPDSRPKVLGFLKTNLTDLAKHYHACYQDLHQKEDQPANYKEALHWYQEFLASFPQDIESPTINYHLADLLREHHSFGQAAAEYERTAYGYAPHEKSAKAGYAAVYAYREHLAAVAPEDKDAVKQEVVRTSLKFADTYPQHEKAAVVLGAAADDLYVMEEYERALDAATKLLEVYPDTDTDVVRAAWLVVGHSAYELTSYSEAESAYLKVLSLLPAEDKTRDDLMDNLAASIYKQGEQANAAQDYRAAADHFLRVGRVAPTSKIRANAEYDAAAALIQLKDWEQAAAVLAGFRDTFPGHELQPEVTKKIAYVYKENGQLSLAAAEYERIETESTDDEIRREALQVAADLYTKAGDNLGALTVYQRYVGYFPQPVELNLETRNKIAEIMKTRNDRDSYLKELGRIVAIDAAAGAARTDRMRYLAGNAALVLAENTYETFLAIKLVKPLEENLQKKKGLMKKAINDFNGLIDYESGELTAAATFYLAEIYAHFSKALMSSERPELTFDYYTVKPGDNLIAIAKRSHSDVGRIAHANNLNQSNLIVAGKKLKIPRGLYPEELEQYELAIEEQAYPFEEKAISVHERNLELISQGIYNPWIDRSLQKLAIFVPARYDKPEVNSDVIASLETYIFATGRPAPADTPASAAGVSVAGAKSADPAVAPATDATAEIGTTASEPDESAGSDVDSQFEPPAAMPDADASVDVGTKTSEPIESAESDEDPQVEPPAAMPDADARVDAGTAASEPIETAEGETNPQSAELAATPAPDATTDAGSTTSETIESAESDADSQAEQPAAAPEPDSTVNAESAEPVAVVEMNAAADTGAARPGTEPVVLQTTAAAR